LKIKVLRHALRINHAAFFAVVGALFDAPMALARNCCLTAR
jgi:hypothetical protein